MDSQRFCRLGHAHTKIIATVGPSSEPLLEEMIESGMSVARINLSHGTRADHVRWIERVREASDKVGILVGILVDIRGPKLRLGTFEKSPFRVRRGERFKVYEGEGPAPPGEIPVAVKGFFDSVELGQRIYLNDGLVELVFDERTDDAFVATVRRGGSLGDKKGVHLPDTPIELEVPTQEDVGDLEFAREQGVDLVGVSFVSRAAELRKVKEIFPEAMIVSKIERAVAVENLDELLELSDGIMVARGDLGVELELEHLPIVQKSLIQSGLKAGRFTITATEMLESMVTTARPTRAEVADVANAVLDGTDAVMLSAETAVGDYPVEAIRTMDRIARSVEESHRYGDLPRVAFRASEPTFSNGIAMSAAQISEVLKVTKIVCFTETGNTVRLISRYRPTAEIIALSPHERVVRQMSVLAHVRPMVATSRETLEDMLDYGCQLLLENQLVHQGEAVVFVAGVPPGVAASTNVIKLHRIGEPIKLG